MEDFYVNDDDFEDISCFIIVDGSVIDGDGDGWMDGFSCFLC